MSINRTTWLFVVGTLAVCVASGAAVWMVCGDRVAEESVMPYYYQAHGEPEDVTGTPLCDVLMPIQERERQRWAAEKPAGKAAYGGVRCE